MSQISASLIDWLQTVTGTPVKYATPIQALWSGYGECFRAVLAHTNTPVVVKAVIPPDAPSHPKGWNSVKSHNRKQQSFDVEHRFYQYYQSSLTDQCYAPRLLFSEVSGNAILMVLEDLSVQGYPHEQSAASVEQCKSPLRWLAAFHATFLGVSDPHLWANGCYWHFATRQEEWLAMPDGPLKSHAASLDRKLSQCRYQTLVHGDAKIANFCFSQDMTRCAAIDFQYIGSGPGVRDVAYFLGSALSDEDLLDATEACLDYYFAMLKHALNQTRHASLADDITKQWRLLYPVACADFHRFLAGWSPDHRKINQALTSQTHTALSQFCST